MAKHVNHRSRLMSFHKAAPLIAVLLGTAALNACSTGPDAVNPAEWYRGTVDFFASEDKAKAKKGGEKESGLVADRGKAPPGANKPFPVWPPSIKKRPPGTPLAAPRRTD